MIHKRKKVCIKCGATYFILWSDDKGFVEHNLCDLCRGV